MEDLRANEELMESDEEEMVTMATVPRLRDLSSFQVMVMVAKRDLPQGCCIRPYGTAKKLSEYWCENEEDINWILSVYNGTCTDFYKFLSRELHREYTNLTHELRVWANQVENILYNEDIDMHQTFSDVVFQYYQNYQ